MSNFFLSVGPRTGPFNHLLFLVWHGSVAEMVMPGDRIKMTAELINPIAIEQGMRFAIREGGRTVGAGVVSKIIE